MSRPQPARLERPVILLADLVARGDGTFVLRPVLADEDGDSWISVGKAARILQLAPRTIYRFMGDLLVFWRVAERKYLISLQSIRALRHATRNPEFWDSLTLQAPIRTSVQARMRTLTASSMQPPLQTPLQAQLQPSLQRGQS